MREGSGKVYAVQREGRDMDVQWRRRPGVVVGALNVCLVCCRLEVVSIGLKRSLQITTRSQFPGRGVCPSRAGWRRSWLPWLLRLAWRCRFPASTRLDGRATVSVTRSIQFFPRLTEESRLGKDRDRNGE